MSRLARKKRIRARIFETVLIYSLINELIRGQKKRSGEVIFFPDFFTGYNTLQYTEVHCSTLQHTAAHCDRHLLMWRKTDIF